MKLVAALLVGPLERRFTVFLGGGGIIQKTES